jgi:hypothetical protein
MNRGLRFPLIMLALCCAGFVAYVLLTAHQLPPRVASHFDGRGVPDGWMTRSAHIVWMLGFGVGVPAFIVFLVSILRLFGGLGLNIPRREYWLAPERREATFDFVLIRAVWLAFALVVFSAGLHGIIIAANARQPVFLPNEQSWLIGGLMIVVTVAWLISLLIHFLRRANASEA